MALTNRLLLKSYSALGLLTALFIFQSCSDSKSTDKKNDSAATADSGKSVKPGDSALTTKATNAGSDSLQAAAGTPGIGFVIPEGTFQDDGVPGLHYFSDAGLTHEIDQKKNGPLPFFNKPDYHLFHFICLEKNEAFYKIQYTDSLVAYVKNDKHFGFSSWDKILMESTAVERTTSDNPVHADCDENSKVLAFNCPDNENLDVEEVRLKDGIYWIKVGFNPDCDADIYDKKPKHGWIKWRTKDQLLIHVMMLC